MRLAISNIAWDIKEDVEVAKILRKFDIDAIDIVPGKYFCDLTKSTNKEISNVRRWWADQGVDIIGAQALLLGTTGLNMFGDIKAQEMMIDHLREVCRISAGLGATRLVFGSPRNRDRLGLSDSQVQEQAVRFFWRLGDVAQEYGVIVCLEPNPIRYGANFMTNSEETARIVAAVGHRAIWMQFDTGSITINGESPESVLKSSSGLIGHIHASEPDLKPLGAGETDHWLMYKTLLQYLPEHVVSIEMLTKKEANRLHLIEQALSYAIECYRPEKGVYR
jgi:sugar phosphate isomerase/epimerase